ncbi:hypothetical protein KVF89_22490 [Nocardioides carbamazepini]|uniref:hypothetical protein n=1 Tax=Nocardioides carbamazepini TaxID=2854259 RepID=UPI002149EBBA|nr:hypothetical protein [Nocardioides carbamazepini]MCR1785326.1 hypothetical protein [Nocardioides carbamazepini]
MADRMFPRLRRWSRRSSRRRFACSPRRQVVIELDATSFVAGMSRAALAVREFQSVARYRRRIQLERSFGLDFVRGEAQRVRAELGLEDR